MPRFIVRPEAPSPKHEQLVKKLVREFKESSGNYGMGSLASLDTPVVVSCSQRSDCSGRLGLFRASARCADKESRVSGNVN